VEEVIEKAKESMSQDATAMRMQAQNLIDRQHRMLEDAQKGCETALALAHDRMRQATKAYEDSFADAIKRQLDNVLESTITEDTLNQEMGVAAQAHRDSILKMTAIPPLVMDETRLQMQIRSAKAEEEIETLQEELKALKEGDKDRLPIDVLRKENEDLRKEIGNMRSKYSDWISKDEHDMVRRANKKQAKQLAQLNLEYGHFPTQIQRLKQAAKMDEGVMVGLKKKLEAAEGELESLKRKRADSTSPERAFTSILKRPAASSPAAQDVPSSSAQPSPKKSRNRKNRWDVAQPGSLPPKSPPTSSNRDGYKRSKSMTSPPKKRDPVLHNQLNSARNKHDILKDINESAATLDLAPLDSSLVFCRSKVEEQVEVTKKALSYVEILVTATCGHLLKGKPGAGNPVQAYLDTLSLPEVENLKLDVDRALEQCEDSSRCMSTYRGGDKLYQRVREQCFTHGGQPLRPHKLDDMLKKLHIRLGCHKLHSIPIGFYYAKWSEKLHFHLSTYGVRKAREQRSLSATSTTTRTPTPERSHSPYTRSSHIVPLSAAVDTSIDKTVPDAEDKLDELRVLRAAIFDDTLDRNLTKKDQAVFWYREERRKQWKLVKNDVMLNEVEWNSRYDQQRLDSLQVAEEQCETLLSAHQQSNGDGPAGQGLN
jgi:hypothetical protein